MLTTSRTPILNLIDSKLTEETKRISIQLLSDYSNSKSREGWQTRRREAPTLVISETKYMPPPQSEELEQTRRHQVESRDLIRRMPQGEIPL